MWFYAQSRRAFFVFSCRLCVPSEHLNDRMLASIHERHVGFLLIYAPLFEVCGSFVQNQKIGLLPSGDDIGAINRRRNPIRCIVRIALLLNKEKAKGTASKSIARCPSKSIGITSVQVCSVT